MKTKKIDDAINSLKHLKKALGPISKCKSVGAITKLLVAKKIKGDRDNTASCPIANYLKKVAGLEKVEVDSDEVKFFIPNINDEDGDGDDSVISLEPSAAVCKFMSKFDDGEIPEVDEDPKEDDAE